MTDIENTPIVFVGAGPGDPDLITVAGRKALEEADLIVYAGSLVSRDMLSWAGPDAEAIDSAGLNLDEIIDKMVSGYRSGRRVVRLHTGDPSLYGAVHEQYQALENQGVPYRVIPGVTAAFAASAALGLEYTLPEICQTLILTRAAGRTPVPEKERLKALAEHEASLAIYLSTSLAGDVAEALEPTYGPDSPVAVVYRASWPDQEILWTTVSQLPDALESAPFNRQALILVGRVLEAVKSDRQAPRSKLYDPTFSHGFRQREEK